MGQVDPATGGAVDRLAEAEWVDRELRLLLVGVRAVLVALALFVVMAAVLLGPRLVHQRQMGGPGACHVTGNVGVCIMP